jgi:hypothetical protein
MTATLASALTVASTVTATASFFVTRTNGASRVVPGVRPTRGRGRLVRVWEPSDDASAWAGALEASEDGVVSRPREVNTDVKGC